MLQNYYFKMEKIIQYNNYLKQSSSFTIIYPNYQRNYISLSLAQFQENLTFVSIEAKLTRISFYKFQIDKHYLKIVMNFNFN